MSSYSENTLNIFMNTIDEIEEMCQEYPGLKNVYDKFKHVYDLVKQDWVGKQNESN